jgi:hypothetical protein
LLQNSVDPLACASAGARRFELPSHDQTAPERLVDGLGLGLRCDHALGDDVDERSQRCGHPDAVHRLDVSFVDPRVLQAENGGMATILRNPGGTVISSFAGAVSEQSRH